MVFDMTSKSPDGNWNPALGIAGLDSNMLHAVGQLMINMSHTEAALRHLLKTKCDVNEEVFDILTSDMKSNKIQRYIREVIKIKLGSSVVHGFIDDQLSRISFIRDKRNQLAHWTWMQHEDQLHIAKTPKSENPIPISVDEVRGWADELATVSVRLFLCSLSEEQMAELVEKADYLSQSPNGEILISLPNRNSEPSVRS